MMKYQRHVIAALLTGGSALTLPATLQADTISPETFEANLEVGESVTIRKDVVIEEGTASSALLDAFFLIDTSTSMQFAINAAKAGANDLLNGLDSFGDVSTGVGVFAERAELGDAIRSGLSTNKSVTETAINDQVNLNDPDSGFDLPESSNTAIELATENLEWRAGSNRFMFVFGDAAAKGAADEDVIEALTDNNVTLVGLNFGSSDFENDIVDLGGTVFSGTATAQSIIDNITAGITTAFSSYENVTIDDFGAGSPFINVDVTCVSANVGNCAGSVASGEFDRSEDRLFEFDVTFTRADGGLIEFETAAVVDGGAVAFERDRFTVSDVDVSPVPIPAAGWMLLTAMGGLGMMRARRK